MAKKKLFNKSKEVKEIEIDVEDSSGQTTATNDFEDEPIAEYKETLYSDSAAKQKVSSNQRVWRNVKGIEESVDGLHIKKAGKQVTELDKKVDKLIDKTKKKHRKPANVVYVVSKPQPGQVKGDWAVRTHGKIFSHHRTKENAIKAAREVAKKREATVMVQNTDGTFSEGFKPRPKK